jgi:polyferredoxin
LKQAHTRKILGFLVVVGLGLLPAILIQFFTKPPTNRFIHIRNFRYGKDPSVIRCNRGDTLHLSFSTDDTGHSFFLEEFDVDAKVSPARDMVEVYGTKDPTLPPIITKELKITARHPGILNYLVAKSYYRCHVWCGPMHAFEHGKLILLPNTLLFFSLGCLLGILVLWFLGLRRSGGTPYADDKSRYRDAFKNYPLLQKLVVSRWPQIGLTLLAMLLVYVVILAALFGTKMSGRNLGVLLMWAVWLFLLVAVMTPLFGRIWCTICPLPVFGDLIQRMSLFTPGKGSRGKYRNTYFGLFRIWPRWLQNGWFKLLILLLLTTFTSTLVANPKVTGLAVLLLILTPTLLALFYEHRAFCRYICPVSVFIGPFSRVSPLALRNKSQKVCDRCKNHYCQNGSDKGWACPYGINVGSLEDNTECGLCMECTRSCMYNNVSLYTRPFAAELGTKTLSDAWTSIAVFTVAVVYCVLYQGHWPLIRDFVNILDKQNWDLFAYYSVAVWVLALLVMPGIFYGLAALGRQWSKVSLSNREVFLGSSGALLPLGLMLWIAFVIPMLFVNTTFVLQSLSDPFGWGWDFFGTANIPWHQTLPRLLPWFQAILILIGIHLSLRNLGRTWASHAATSRQLFLLNLPVAAFKVFSAVALIFFFTN